MLSVRVLGTVTFFSLGFHEDDRLLSLKLLVIIFVTSSQNPHGNKHNTRENRVMWTCKLLLVLNQVKLVAGIVKEVSTVRKVKWWNTCSPGQIGPPELAKRNVECLAKLEVQLNNEKDMPCDIWGILVMKKVTHCLSKSQTQLDILYFTWQFCSQVNRQPGFRPNLDTYFLCPLKRYHCP